MGSCVGVGVVPLNWEVAAGGSGTLGVTSRGRLLLSLAYRVSQGQQQPKATKTDFQSPPKSCIFRLPQTIVPCAPGHGASSTLKAVSTEPHSVGFKLWGKLAASLWVFFKKLVRGTIKPLWAPECTYADINKDHSSSPERIHFLATDIIFCHRRTGLISRLRAFVIRAGDGGQREQS